MTPGDAAPLPLTPERKRLALLLGELPIAMATDVVAAVIWMLVLRHSSPAAFAVAGWWVASFFIVQLLTLAFYLQHRRAHRAATDLPLIMGRFMAVTVGRAGIWALGTLVVLPDDAISQIYAAALLATLLTVALRTNGQLLRSMLVYSLLMGLPLSYRLLSSGDFDRILLALGGLLFFLPMLLSTSYSLTRRAQSAIQMQDRNAALLTQLRSETKALEQSMEQTEVALRFARQAGLDKTRFLAAASHDLRQPVHAIGLFVAALKAETFQGRAKYLVDRLDRSLAGLDELFNRLLDMSRLDSGVITPSPKSFAFEPLAQTLESRFNQMSSMKNLVFRVHCPAGMYGHSDLTLLTELIMNLLSNSFRYTERGGVLLCFRPRRDHVLIQVWDTGCGIPTSDLELIFQEFVQLDNASRDRRKGLGLGLAIVKRISTLLDLPISVRSRVGHGSVFQLKVARDNDPQPVSGTDDETGAELQDVSGTLVLVVDDEIDILAAMEALLNAWGCFAILARSVGEAMKYCDSSPRFPDIIITDHRLTNRETSFDVVDRLRPQLPYDIPIIVVSGEPGTSLEKQVRDRGWWFMNKPVNAGELRTTLMQALSNPVTK